MKLKSEMTPYENDSIQINKSELCHEMQQILHSQRDGANSLRKLFQQKLLLFRYIKIESFFPKCFPWVLLGL